MPSATPIPANTPIQYQAPIEVECTPRLAPVPAARLAMIRPMRVLACSAPAAALPARGVLLDARSLIWGATILAYLVFEAQYAQPLHTGGAEDVVEHDVGWAIDLWGRWDSGWFLGIAAARLRRPGPLVRVLPALPAARPRRRLVPARPLPAGGLSRLAGRLGRRVRAPLEARAASSTASETANRSVLYLALFPTTLFLFAVYSESLYLLLSVAAFLLAVRGRWAWAGVDGRARGAHARLGRDAPPGARDPRLALLRTAAGRCSASRSRCR